MFAEGEYDLKSVSSTNRTGDVIIQGTKLGVGLERIRCRFYEIDVIRE